MGVKMTLATTNQPDNQGNQSITFEQFVQFSPTAQYTPRDAENLINVALVTLRNSQDKDPIESKKCKIGDYIVTISSKEQPAAKFKFLDFAKNFFHDYKLEESHANEMINRIQNSSLVNFRDAIADITKEIESQKVTNKLSGEEEKLFDIGINYAKIRNNPIQDINMISRLKENSEKIEGLQKASIGKAVGGLASLSVIGALLVVPVPVAILGFVVLGAGALLSVALGLFGWAISDRLEINKLKPDEKTLKQLDEAKANVESYEKQQKDYQELSQNEKFRGFFKERVMNLEIYFMKQDPTGTTWNYIKDNWSASRYFDEIKNDFINLEK